MSSETITLPNGVVLHRWTNPTGDEWACAASDHGPFCRLCQPVDGILAACLANVMDGVFDLRIDRDGEFLFHVTEEGTRRAKHLIETVAELGEMHDRLTHEERPDA